MFIGLNNAITGLTQDQLSKTINSLFSKDEQGTWYDPSDFIAGWRRNLLKYSEQFDNATWVKDAGGTGTVPTVTGNQGLAPDGTNTADRLQLNKGAGANTSNFIRVIQSVTVPTGATTTKTVWLKSYDGVSSYSIQIRDGGAAAPSPTVVVTGQWQQFTYQSTIAGTTTQLGIVLIGGAGTSNAADLLAWGAQLELGSAPTSYQKITDGVQDYLAVHPLPVLYQDSAGTTPVTAFEQPVGLIKDKSGRGNHAFQATSASRPVLSARYNLASVSTGSALLTTTRTTYVDDGTKFLDGTPFYKLKEDTTAASSHFGVPAAVTLKAGVSYTAVYYVKAAGRTRIRLDVQVTGGWSPATPIVIYDLVAKTATPISGAPTGTITDLGDGIFRLTFTATIGASDISTGVYPVLLNDAGVNSYTGDGGSGMYITGYDIKPTNQADLPYQRVTTSTNYDTVGFRPYLKFDGVDDFLQTNSIDFSGTDKMTVVAGVRKLSDATIGMVAELTTDAGTLNGFYLGVDTTPTSRFVVGTPVAGIRPNTGTEVSPYTEVIAVTADKSQSSAASALSLRMNGVLRNEYIIAEADPAGNFANAALYIGRRAGTTLPFNGQLYGLVIRGALSSTGEIQGSESYMNLHTGAY